MTHLKLCLLRSISAISLGCVLVASPVSADEPKAPKTPKQEIFDLYPGVLATMGVPSAAYKNLPATHSLIVRGDACAEDAAAVAALLPSETSRKTYGSLIFIFANKEGGCHADPPGFNDNSQACGCMQVHDPHKIIEGATCAKVRADRRLGMRVGLAVMLMKAKECGSIGAGLTAYAGRGVCPPKGWMLPLVIERCKLAGVDCSMPWTPGA